MANVWEFKPNDETDLEKVDLKLFKPVGKFFEDVATLSEMFNVRIHPAIRESSYR